MESEHNKIKKRMTSEAGLILQALLGIGLSYWWLGFEPTVLVALAVILGHVAKMSWKK